MIKNERKYRITKAQAKKFEQVLAQLSKERSIGKGMHPRLAKAQKDALQSQLDSLTKQIKDYERIAPPWGQGARCDQHREASTKSDSRAHSGWSNSKGISCGDWNKGAAGPALRSNELCVGEPGPRSAGGANSGSRGVTTIYCLTDRSAICEQACVESFGIRED
jgi:hypothetical protein